MKVWAYVILAGILVTAIGTGARMLYKSGYNAAVVDQQELAIEAQNKAIDDARAEWEATREAAEAEVIIEERIVEVIREVEREVPRVVERIVEVKPECRDLGTEYAGLLNAAVRASNSRADSSAETTAAVATPVQ